MLILKTLALEPRLQLRHRGSGSSRSAAASSRSTPDPSFRPSAGSSGPAGSKASGARPRTTEGHAYYILTDDGRRKLREETREWTRQVAAIARILEA